MYSLVSLSPPVVGATMFVWAWKASSAWRAESRSLRNSSIWGANQRAVWSAAAAFIATEPSMVDARNAFAISAAWFGSPDLYLIASTLVPRLNRAYPVDADTHQG